MDSQRRPLFTPHLLLSAPRRSAGIPNASGTTVLFTTTSYSFQSHSQTTRFQALLVQTGETIDIAANQEISNINWLDDDNFVCLRSERDGTTSLLYARFSAAWKHGKNATTLQSAGTLNASASCLKVVRINDGHDDFAVVAGAPACGNGRLYTPVDAARKSNSSGRVYDKLFVRHWDRYKGPERNSLWYGKLSLAESGAADQYKLSQLTNLLAGTNMECPIPPFGGSDQFDVRKDAIIWLARDPGMNPSWNTKCNVYIRQIDSWDSQEGTPTASEIRQIDVAGFDGLAASPVFAPVGDKAAFLMMRKNRYEGDKNQVFVVSDVTTSQRFEVVRAFSSAEKNPLEGTWDRSPSSVCFAADGESLVVIAEDQGCDRVWFIRGGDVATGAGVPCPLTHSGTAIDVRCLVADGRIFVSGSSMVDDSWYMIINNPTIEVAEAQQPAILPQKPTWLHSPSDSGSKYGLHPSQITSIHTPASNPSITSTIHSWIIKPSTFDKTKKYPVAYLIHGGPHAAWKDAWSTRWNPAVFAEQGYIVVAPNISGSSGYGQAFTDSSVRNWGGDPYHDFVKVFEWVGENLEGADNERAVGLGHSYGGFMVSEIVDGFWWLLWDE
jgi:dipeptidyl aminopeptidase/acylaminoacyl peptidase